MSRRRLRPEERTLWEQVARTTRARPGRSADIPTAPAPPSPAFDSRTAAPMQKAPAALPPDFRIGHRAGANSTGHDLARPITEALRDAPVTMDRRQFMRMNRGKLTPEARIDLHGMTLAQAQGALGGFVADAWARGLRLVLVITGKGLTDGRNGAADDGPIPRRPGALRHAVPAWLRQAPLSGMVLDIRPAHRRHGGDGALYVYLRKRR